MGRIGTLMMAIKRNVRPTMALKTITECGIEVEYLSGEYGSGIHGT